MQQKDEGILSPEFKVKLLENMPMTNRKEIFIESRMYELAIKLDWEVEKSRNLEKELSKTKDELIKLQAAYGGLKDILYADGEKVYGELLKAKEEIERLKSDNPKMKQIKVYDTCHHEHCGIMVYPCCDCNSELNRDMWKPKSKEIFPMKS